MAVLLGFFADLRGFSFSFLGRKWEVVGLRFGEESPLMLSLRRLCLSFVMISELGVGSWDDGGGCVEKKKKKEFFDLT